MITSNYLRRLRGNYSTKDCTLTRRKGPVHAQTLDACPYLYIIAHLYLCGHTDITPTKYIVTCNLLLSAIFHQHSRLFTAVSAMCSRSLLVKVWNQESTGDRKGWKVLLLYLLFTVPPHARLRKWRTYHRPGLRLWQHRCHLLQQDLQQEDPGRLKTRQTTDNHAPTRETRMVNHLRRRNFRCSMQCQ